MSAMDYDAYFDELFERISWIRDIYKKNKIKLNKGQGLCDALDEAESIAKCEKIQVQEEPSNEDLEHRARSVHVIWSLYEILKKCHEHSLPLKGYLKEINTGTIDHGKPGESKNIYYKDFECELLIAYGLLKSKLDVQFPEKGNDPIGDLICESIFIEVKHLNSKKRVKKCIKKSCQKWKKEGVFGIFALGVEDMHEMADVTDFGSRNEYEKWIEAKRSKMEIEGAEILKYASGFDSILGFIQTQTTVLTIEGRSNMIRLSNSVLFQKDDISDALDEAAQKIARAFNPNPKIWTA